MATSLQDLSAQDLLNRIEPAGRHPFFQGNITTIGWEGDKDAAMVKENGWFFVRDSLNIAITFDISSYPGYNNDVKSGKVKWYPHSGYLPCFITEFTDNWEEFGPIDQMNVKLMHFADKVTIDGNDFVIAYSRVAVKNLMDKEIYQDPGASGILTPLNNPYRTIQPGQTTNFDYAIVIDRFGNGYSRPSSQQIKDAGSWDEHFDHMKEYWNKRLAQITDFNTPDPELNNAYKMGFIYTLIARDGDKSYNVAEIGYNVLFNHDYLGIYLSLLKLGFFDNAYEQLKLLGEGRGPYHDHHYRWSLLLSFYLMKTGDVAILEKEDGYLYKKCLEAYEITLKDLTGPGGIIGRTWDIDDDGLWTWDDESALTGFQTLAYVAGLKGDLETKAKAEASFQDLMAKVNNRILEMADKHQINYIPASLEAPNEEIENVVKKGSSFWATPFWFGMNWNTYLAGGEYVGPLKEWIDNTYKWGFEKQAKEGFKPHNVGTWVSYGGGVASAYNSAFSISGLLSHDYRQQAIKSYQYLIEYGQSAPYGWWEMFHAPDADNRWEGNHPTATKTNWFACPHQWGQAGMTQALMDALVADFYDGRLLIGRGYLDEWVKAGKKTVIKNHPIAGGKRINLTIEMISDKKVELSISGDQAENDILFNLPQFANNVKEVSTGKYNSKEGWVEINSSVKKLIVTLK